VRARLAALPALLVLAACSAPPAPAPPPAAVPVAPVAGCPAPTTTVGDADALTEALAGARPGAVIVLEPGTYPGAFAARTSGEPDRPVTVCGPREAVLDGGPVDGGYTLHLDGVSHWRVVGLTVRGGQKGVMVDAGQHNLLEGLLVESVGDEAVHLRTGSSDNVVRGLTIRDTGLRREQFGEGVYIGSAESNWCELTACQPDRSDRNLVEGTTVSATTAESVDVKEGTSDGVLRGNTFSGAGMTDADALVDVKGNGWTVTGNTGTDSPKDGMQVFEILPGWGLDNVFTANTLSVAGDGYAVNVTRNSDRNPVACDNVAVGTGAGLARDACR
jgi:hypothetical protein